MRAIGLLLVVMALGLLAGCGQSGGGDTLPETYMEELEAKLLLTRAEVAAAEVQQARKWFGDSQRAKSMERAAFSKARKAQHVCWEGTGLVSCGDIEQIENIVRGMKKELR
jgi:hypothetical protein